MILWKLEKRILQVFNIPFVRGDQTKGIFKLKGGIYFEVGGFKYVGFRTNQPIEVMGMTAQ